MLEEIKEQTKDNKSEELMRLLQKNLERSEEILQISQDIKKYIRWQQIWGVLRLLLIVVPLVIGFLYLPPLINQALESYKSLLTPPV